MAAEATGEDTLTRFLSWLQDTFWFVRKEQYPDFDVIMSEARDFAKNPDATMVPLIFHEPRKVWAEKVLTGEDLT